MSDTVTIQPPTMPTGSVCDVSIQTIAMPRDANWNGDIFGGWIVSQMDLAGAACARRRAKGRVTTVAINSMVFLHPVPVGSMVSCYTCLIGEGQTSMKIHIEVWIQNDQLKYTKVTEGLFIFVAIDDEGKKRLLPPLDS
ncbi:acyl-CoA thioesterase [Candidatus Nitrosacidococcus tergens]|uniref:Acyl-CoA thioester hydrolase YciA n=1 Tax=Candidatus Nitrosacidococcus tergens TaxID=553981 RepID=A0A7G1QC33_9GAMM|nr:acyl-CoA thioesterase [Candidatus Nitrosacidococcus tergens]CAB1277618.1 Acyl-CoA thioester hydrolase YciA [Candidatus Nitrosacidococcus tergens]